MNRILLIEDDQALANELCAFLQENGLDVHTVYSGETALAAINRQQYQLLLLDVGLPDYSGFTLCQKIRCHSHTPIIILTAYDSEDDVIAGLQSGADDYVTKPCSLKILHMRIQAQLRRHNWETGSFSGRMKSGDLEIDLEHHTVYINGNMLSLGETEFSLCATLAQNDGRIMPRTLLLQRIWDQNDRYIEDNTLSVHISRLRKKLGFYCGIPYIDTIKGIGYRWNHPTESVTS